MEGGDVLTEDICEDARSLLNQIVHFLDIPMITVIVYCGTVRPDSWAHVASAIALCITALLVITVPRLARQSA